MSQDYTLSLRKKLDKHTCSAIYLIPIKYLHLKPRPVVL